MTTIHRLVPFVALALAACATKQQTRVVAPTTSSPATAAAGAPASSGDDAAIAGGRGDGGLQTIYFAYDRDELDPAARNSLAAGAGALGEKREARLRIAGHTDDRGTEEYNMALGDRRANAAKRYLVTLGVDGGRIDTVSFGEARPSAAGHDETAWSKNRRAELELLNR